MPPQPLQLLLVGQRPASHSVLKVYGGGILESSWVVKGVKILVKEDVSEWVNKSLCCGKGYVDGSVMGVAFSRCHMHT